jgi:hypothetical protein
MCERAIQHQVCFRLHCISRTLSAATNMRGVRRETGAFFRRQWGAMRNASATGDMSREDSRGVRDPRATICLTGDQHQMAGGFSIGLTTDLEQQRFRRVGLNSCLETVDGIDRLAGDFLDDVVQLQIGG